MAEGKRKSKPGGANGPNVRTGHGDFRAREAGLHMSKCVRGIAANAGR